jgi:diguanylate cyclase (GGDEF)-like protein
MIFEGLALTGRMFVAEIHRPHKQAYALVNDPRARIRVVGFVMFIISTAFLSILFLLAFLQSLGTFPTQIDMLPTLEDFQHAPSIFAGLIAGVFLLAPLRLIEFSSAHLIKTENFLAIAAFSSVATLFWEWITKPLTGLSLQTVDILDFWALVSITIGGLLIAVTKIESSKRQQKTWRNYVKYETQDIALVEDSKEIIANTLEFYENNIGKVAKALNIPEKAVMAIADDVENVLAFKGKILQEIERLYRQNIALKDALTGLLNRAGFMKEVRSACTKGEEFHLLYIDLDKFKPVNDTYGHEAGDAILQGVAERLNAYFYKGEAVTRLGGDEYCILQPKVKSEDLAMHVRLLVELLSEPFKVDGIDDEICISASVGVASFPDDGDDPESLLHVADTGMYDDKENKNDS